MGTVDGQPGQQVGRLNVAGGDTQTTLSADFSTINPSSVRVKLYNAAGGLLLDQARPPSLLMGILLPDLVQIADAGYACAPSGDPFTLRLVNPVTVVVAGSTVPNVSKVVVLAENPTAVRTNISRLELNTEGNPNIELSNVTASLKGKLDASILGGAILSSVDGGIILGNLQPSGVLPINDEDPSQDGIRLAVPNSSGFRFGLAIEAAEASHLLNVAAYATVNGVSNQLAGQLACTKTASGYQAIADYSAISSPTVKVRVYNRGQMVADLPGQLPGSVSFEELPSVCEKLKGPPPPYGGGDVEFILEMDEVQPISVGANTYQGDRVAILAEPTQSITVGPYQAVEITGVGIEEMFVGDPTALRPVTGIVNLGNYIPDESGRQIRLEFRNSGEPALLDAKLVTLGAGGSFSTVAGGYGPVEIRAKGGTWLRRAVTVNVDDNGASGVLITLPNGDCDGNGVVDSDDFDILITTFGLSTGDPGFDPRADLDGSGSVDSDDFDILTRRLVIRIIRNSSV